MPIIARNVIAIFGAFDLSNTNEPGRFQLTPRKIHIHGDWDPMATRQDADLSLLEFYDGSIIYNDFVQPICVWDREYEPFITAGDVAMWNESADETKDYENIPKIVNVGISSNNNCGKVAPRWTQDFIFF